MSLINYESVNICKNNEIVERYPNLREFFIQISNPGQSKNLLFECIACKPLKKIISSSATSNSNLRTHISVRDSSTLHIKQTLF